MRLTRVPAILLAVLAACRTLTAQPSDAPFSPEVLQEQLVEAFDSEAYDRALVLARRLVDVQPKHPAARYNLACALAMSGARREATDTLLDAISIGFVDYHHMERDPHLEPLRETDAYRTILLGWSELLDARGEADLRTMREGLGESRYTFHTDEELRLNWACALDERACERARAEVDRVHRWTAATLPVLLEAPAHRPPPWVSVIIPDTADFVRLVGTPHVGGYYDRDRKRLVSRDIGPSMRHEVFHVLHWRHMDRIGQEHAIWVQEGLAALFEDLIERGGDADAAPETIGGFAPSWRTNIVKRLEQRGGLLHLDRFCRLPRRVFMGGRSRAFYAQARAVMLYLDERGLLAEWYAAYVEGFGDDPTGARAIERVTGKPLREVDGDFRAWLRSLPTVSEIHRPRGATLGVPLAAGAGDGPMVDGIVGGPGGLRNRDVILAVDGVATPTLDDLYRVLGAREPGETVSLDVRRGRRRMTMDVTLGSPDDEPPGF